MTVQVMNSTDTNQTVDAQTFVQSPLLAAGSHISAMDLYRMQSQLKIYRGKYYHVDDVIDLFTVFNGVVTDMTNHSSRKDAAMEELRSESTALAEAATEATDVIEYLSAQNENLQSQVVTLQLGSQTEKNLQDRIQQLEAELADSREQFTNLITSSVEKLQKAEDATNEVAELTSELETLKSEQSTISSEEVEGLQNRISELEEAVAEQGATIEGLTSDNNLLNYKVDSMRMVSQRHVATLTKIENKEGVL